MTSSSEVHYGARISAAISAIFTLILIGTVSYHNLEPWTWLQSFYFTVTTLTTVGYGDFYPTTDAARLFTTIFILVGVTVALTSLTIIGTAYIEQRAQRLAERNARRK